MVKLVDTTLPFADVVARHRRDQASTAAATFGLSASTHDWRATYPDATAVAGIGASEQALSDPGVDLTQQVIGASGGLLVDLGFQVCPIGAITSGMLPPSLLVWVAGETSTEEERERLSSLGVPGVWIGSGPDAVDGWARVEPEVFDDRVQFVRRFVAAVASLVEVPEATYVSRFVGDAQDFRRPDEPPVLVITEDLLDELGVTGCGRDEQEQAVNGWLRANTPNKVLALSLRMDGFLAENVSNNLSNELRRTGTDDGGRATAETPADLHRHGRRRTTPDVPGPRTAGS